MKGTLFVVATPIGNLGDMTFRAVEILRRVPVIAAEDTRRTRTLLTHFGIGKPELVRIDASASSSDLERVLGRLEAGDDVAIVTDAGTPVVSDPGSALVRAARERGLTVSPIPGPSAVTALLSVAGLELATVRFIGFLPRGDLERAAALARARDAAEPFVFFEAPHRMKETLAAVAGLLGAAEMIIGRELTKLHEEILAGPASTLAASEAEREWLGELAICVVPSAKSVEEPTAEAIEVLVDRELAKGRRAKEISELLAIETGLSKRDIYDVVLARKASR